MKNLVILGATGSIGTQTLEVVDALPDRLSVVGLSAHRSWQTLFEEARTHNPAWVTLTDGSLKEVVDGEALPDDSELLWGESGIHRMVTAEETDVVVAAMVGAAGLRGTIWALEAGKSVALANKESLVVGGPIVTELAERNGCSLLPIDSEHSAILQSMAGSPHREIERIILTASGGPFRTTPLESFEDITVEQALRHPTWQMGTKITIDSATMMNKTLEVIEAHWLFDLPAEKIDVVIHPQSMIHSMVEFVDGSVIAQLSPPDMRLPIQYALTYPDRLPGPARKLDLASLGRLDFEEPDLERYPALRLGFDVVKRRGTSGAALNAANEVAVARFLEGQIRFPDIVRLCEDILESHPFDSAPTLDVLLSVDQWARKEAEAWTRSVSSRF
ncbi:1-deoxy-D-xylulose 5-phosphate reductoisomerase [Planctomycetes bacterium Pan216]|uniref:1-deoxy-D-xylulose 5-phosphate reductoisomerase n=1 Tax=Kolteria novifilia TaxID=2527975 RepID=A0A518BC65_9BACT|nr:1-deoxy-D-xylulose 5-phosphate reductoisomerase [Planctomycetes bacterium Pan216]